MKTDYEEDHLFITEAAGALESIDHDDPDFVDLPERIGSPAVLRSVHDRFADNDADASVNRSRVQEQVDFVPPIDPQELIEMGQGDRFNVNYGMVASMKNEAVGAYLDIFSSPPNLVKIKLKDTMDEDMREIWAGMMGEQFTKMLRSWDGSMPRMLELSDIFVTHGVGIPWFQDSNCLFFEVGSMEDFKFDNECQAVSSMVEITTVERELQIPDLYAKIESILEKDEEDQPEWVEGWHVETVKKMLLSAKPRNLVDDEHWNMERVTRRVKANRFSSDNELASISMIWGMVRELDGRISVYATMKECPEEWKEWTPDDEGCEEWAYKKRFEYEDANQAFLIFPFSIGNKNQIHTIRGLGYFLFEAGVADNMLRNKLMDAARSRATEVYQSEGGIETAEDLAFIDIGHALIAPHGLKGMGQPAGVPLDKSVGYALDQNQRILDRHSGGLASQSLLENPAARRNELQVAAELEHINKMLSFAISLFYAPYDKLIRELVRRAFTCRQTDLVARNLVKRMKEACLKAGVPEEAFDQIDLEATQATRVTGAGSRGSRITMFTQLTQFYPEMDPLGQEWFAYDFCTEVGGIDRSERYFGRPGVRRDHVDSSLIQLENARLREGDFLDPIDGENKMMHLEGHLAEIEEGLEGVDKGMVDIGEFALHNVSLFKHLTDTVEATSVHETRLKQLNAIRQRIQQVGEIMDNGFRHLEKLKRTGEPLPGQAQQAPQGPPQPGMEGQPGQPQQDPAAAQEQEAFQREEARKDQESFSKQHRIFQEGMAKLNVLRENSKAKLDIERAKLMADLAALDAKTAAELRRQEILTKATKE